MLSNFHLAKNHKISNDSTTTKAREIISTYLESIEFHKNFYVGLTKFKDHQILLIKISHRTLLKTKPGNTKGGSITVPLTSCLTGLESAVCQLIIFVFICRTESKPVKQEVNSTVINPL
jgi:hypothetical protein